MDGADDALYTAAAKGADQLIKLTGDFESGLNNHALARALAALVETLEPDLLLTGVQAHNDLDGSLGPLLAALLEMPYLGYVAGLSILNGRANVRKEYPGGLIAENGAGHSRRLGYSSLRIPAAICGLQPYSTGNAVREHQRIPDRCLGPLRRLER